MTTCLIHALSTSLRWSVWRILCSMKDLVPTVDSCTLLKRWKQTSTGYKMNWQSWEVVPIRYMFNGRRLYSVWLSWAGRAIYASRFSQTDLQKAREVGLQSLSVTCTVLIVAGCCQSRRFILLHRSIIIHLCSTAMSQNDVTNGLSIPQRPHQNWSSKPVWLARYYSQCGS